MTMYAKDDPRSQLASVPAAREVDPATPVRPAQYLEFTERPPSEVSPAGSRTWLVRGQNAVIAWTEAVAGDRFTREGQPDEYAVLLYSDSASIRVTAGGDKQEVAEPAFVVVPPGDSVVEAVTDGPLIRVFSTVAGDLAGAALNAEKLILCTGAPGILERVDDPGSLISYTDLKGLQRLKENGSIKDGMLPKAKAIEEAIRGGVRRVHVVSYKAPEGILAEVFTNEGTGTLVVADINALTPAELTAS